MFNRPGQGERSRVDHGKVGYCQTPREENKDRKRVDQNSPCKGSGFREKDKTKEAKMIKRVDPPDVDAENYGFDLSTQDGKLLYMRYWHQLEHEDDADITAEEDNYDSSTAEMEEIIEASRNYTQEDLDEMVRDMEEKVRQDYRDALYIVLHSKLFWLIQFILITAVMTLTLFLTKHFSR